MLGICNTWHHFGQDEDGFQLNLVEFFFSGIFSRGSTPVHWLVQGNAHCRFSVTVFEMPMKRFSQGVTPGEGEEEEGGPVDRVAQHRQASQLMEVDREMCEV